ATAPPENPEIAADRTRHTAERKDIDTALTQVQVLAQRADQLADRIGDQRRALFAGRLLARSSGVLDPAFWRDAIGALPGEIAAIRQDLQQAWVFARNQGGAGGFLAAAAMLAALALAGLALARWWRRWLREQHAESRFGRALAAMAVLL